MKVKILGTGCAKCNKIYDEAAKAAQQSGLEVELSKVEKIDEIAGYGVMMTPALVIDEEVVSSGKVLKAAQIVSLLMTAASEQG